MHFHGCLGSMDLMSPLNLFLFTVFIAVASNIFSNVPLTVLVLAQLTPCTNQRLLVLYLAWIATIAGNLTLFGSVANLIVAQQAEVVCARWRSQRTRRAKRARSRQNSSRNETVIKGEENAAAQPSAVLAKLNQERAMEAIENYHLTFWRYLAVGPISTLLVSAVGILVIRLIMLIVS